MLGYFFSRDMRQRWCPIKRKILNKVELKRSFLSLWFRLALNAGTRISTELLRLLFGVKSWTRKEMGREREMLKPRYEPGTAGWKEQTPAPSYAMVAIVVRSALPLASALPKPRMPQRVLQM